MKLTALERIKARGYCVGPETGVPVPSDVGLDHKANCRSCGKRVAVTVRGRYAHHKPSRKAGTP